MLTCYLMGSKEEESRGERTTFCPVWSDFHGLDNRKQNVCESILCVCVNDYYWLVVGC